MNIRLIIIAILIAFPLFLLKSSNVDFNEDYPELNITSSNSIVINNTVYSFTSVFTLNIEAYGYESKKVEFNHRDSDKLIILIEKPVNVVFKINDTYEQFILDNQILKSLDNIKLKKGIHTFKITSDNHLTYESDIDINKYTNELLVPIILKSIDKSLEISSSPNNAKIYLNNIELGVTPITVNLDKTLNKITLKKTGYKNKNIQYYVDNNNKSNVKYELEADANIISLITDPSSASIFLDGDYIGISPITLLNPNKGIIKIKKYGYLDKSIEIKKNTKAINSKLKKDMADVSFDSNPVSKVYLNGNYIGLTPFKKAIQKIKHNVLYEASGYRSINETIEPLKDILNVYKNLLTEKQASLIENKNNAKNSIGSKLVLMNPGSLKLGSSLKESRRDINEIERRVEITKHFYISENLITETQYNNYVGANKISNNPINNISWIDAAKFCNWLSKKEGLNQFYVIKNNTLIYFNTDSNGYRLPTEAEWEYAAKSNSSNDLIYSWGSNRKITKLVGNIADQSTEGILTNFVSDYDDGYQERSPVGAFSSNQNGINDITGNLSEWVNDFYAVEIIDSSKTYIDYIGPLIGTTHVIKGSNYYSSTSLQLGLSYRTYGNEPNELIGFRIARWIY